MDSYVTSTGEKADNKDTGEVQYLKMRLELAEDAIRHYRDTIKFLQAENSRLRNYILNDHSDDDWK